MCSQWHSYLFNQKSIIFYNKYLGGCLLYDRHWDKFFNSWISIKNLSNNSYLYFTIYNKYRNQDPLASFHRSGRLWRASSLWHVFCWHSGNRNQRWSLWPRSLVLRKVLKPEAFQPGWNSWGLATGTRLTDSGRNLSASSVFKRNSPCLSWVEPHVIWVSSKREQWGAGAGLLGEHVLGPRPNQVSAGSIMRDELHRCELISLRGSTCNVPLEHCFMPNLNFSNSPQINKCPKVTMGVGFKLCPFLQAPFPSPSCYGMVLGKSPAFLLSPTSTI